MINQANVTVVKIMEGENCYLDNTNYDTEKWSSSMRSDVQELPLSIYKIVCAGLKNNFFFLKKFFSFYYRLRGICKPQ